MMTAIGILVLILLVVGIPALIRFAWKEAGDRGLRVR